MNQLRLGIIASEGFRSTNVFCAKAKRQRQMFSARKTLTERS
ncbi:hypothetical protein [Lysinibacillus xylanilyticus]